MEYIKVIIYQTNLKEREPSIGTMDNYIKVIFKMGLSTV
jgi:hypothetical protein